MIKFFFDKNCTFFESLTYCSWVWFVTWFGIDLTVTNLFLSCLLLAVINWVTHTMVEKFRD